MKKTLMGILIGLVILAVGVTSAFAAGPGGRHHGGNYAGTGTGTGVCQYVDANGDGICDNCNAAHTSCGRYYTDANGDGICDNCGTTTCGQGGSYVDSNGDGVCDNYTGSQGGHHGSGLWGGCRR